MGSRIPAHKVAQVEIRGIGGMGIGPSAMPLVFWIVFDYAVSCRSGSGCCPKGRRDRPNDNSSESDDCGRSSDYVFGCDAPLVFVACENSGGGNTSGCRQGTVRSHGNVPS